MGRVYLGRDPQLRRFVAVKVLLQSLGADAEAHARFQREAQAIAAVSHANVVAIYNVGELPDGTPYFVMQYVGGGSMADRIAASGPLPMDAAEGVLGDVAAALAAAHRRGIVHRDVKPANVLWDEDGERATVSDFGIASLQGEEGEMRITASGMAVGSPEYMSPEQLLLEPATPKSDIYALGLLAYELLVARGPFDARMPHDIVAAHLRAVPRPLSELRPDVPPALEALLLRCLSKSPAERPTAEEVTQALTPGAADVLEWPPPGLERARATAWRLMLMPALGTLFLLLPLLLFVRIGAIGGGVLMPIVLAGSSLLGFAAFASGGLRAWRARKVLSHAARLGYRWRTLLEVMSDKRGDTGALIAGTREYAALPPASRARLRVLRVLRAMLMLLAAPLALVAAVVALVVQGGQRGGDDVLFASVLWTWLLLGGCGLACGFYERVTLTPIRGRRTERTSHTSTMELAPAWYAAFERSRDGQWLGPGRPVSRTMTELLAPLGALVVFGCAALILMVTTITVTGQYITSAEYPFGNDLLAYQAQRLVGGVSYRLPPDGRTTPLEAGDALLAIASTAHARSTSGIEHAVSVDYPQWRRVIPDFRLFPGSNLTTWTTVAIREAAHGLTAPQRAVLEQAAAFPARDEFSRAARAPSADVYGALLKLPATRPIGPFEYPTVAMYAVSAAAESHSARAALDIADARPADAERLAREIIAVGALLLDMHLVGDNVTGIDVLARGVSTLEAVYVATGREREARTLLDSMMSASAHPSRLPSRSDVAGLRRVMRSPQAMRGARMEALFPLLVRSCADPRQLLFGVDTSYRRTVAYARDSLARYPSERVWVDGLGGWLAGDITMDEDVSLPGPLIAMAHALDRVVGGHRFTNCAVLAPVRSLM